MKTVELGVYCFEVGCFPESSYLGQALRDYLAIGLREERERRKESEARELRNEP
jgi:hypothetical protein